MKSGCGCGSHGEVIERINSSLPSYCYWVLIQHTSNPIQHWNRMGFDTGGKAILEDPPDAERRILPGAAI